MKRMKRQVTDRAKIFANHMSDKGLTFRMNEELSKRNTKSKKSNKKWVRDVNIHFTEEDIQMESKHMKRCSTSLAIREMKIKRTMRLYLLIYISMILVLCIY